MRYTTTRNGKNVIPLLNAVCGIDMPYWRIDKADDLHSYLSGDAADKFAAYEDAEEQGRLVILPCKVGDTLYEIDLPEYGVIVCNVLCFTYGRSNITGELTWCVAVNVVGGHGLGSCYTFNPDDFGTTVFLTRGAAKAALKGGLDNV